MTLKSPGVSGITAPERTGTVADAAMFRVAVTKVRRGLAGRHVLREE